MNINSLHKALAFFRITVVLIIQLLMNGHAALGQTKAPLDQRITISFKDKSIAEALKTIGQQIHYSFVYSDQIIHSEKHFSRKFENEKISHILTAIMAQKGLKYQVSGNQIYIGKDQVYRYQLSGNVQSGGHPLEAVSVNIGEHRVSSDVEGNFKLSFESTRQNIEVIATYVGHKVYKQNIQIQKSGIQHLQITLEPINQEISAVQVIGQSEAQKIKKSGFNVNSISSSKYEHSSTDVNQVLNSSTGIRIREAGGLGSDYNFSINGLSGKAVRFFIDGIPMENYGIGMSFNNIPINLANRLDIYKGVVPAELGADALGGAVNLVTDKGIQNFLDASYSFGSFNTHRAAVNANSFNQKTGLFLKLTSFYNYADNNYWMHSNPKYDAAIQVPDGNGNFVDKSVRRFHDRYKSGMLQAEFGVINKPWADVFAINMLYNQHDKEFQTGARQSVVYGHVNRNGKYYMPSIRYRKDNFLTEGMTASAYVSYGIDKYSVVDTSSRTYWWDGTVRSSSNNYGEIGASIPQSLTNYENRYLLGRLNLSYHLTSSNILVFNQNYTKSDQESFELLKSEEFTPSGQSKSISSFSFQNNAVDNRLQTDLFAKLFHFNIQIAEVTSGRNQRPAQQRSYTNFGYGIASRYMISSSLLVKGSYEHAYRLPELIEVLGDGVNVVANPDIKPESSHNLNLGLIYSGKVSNHFYSVDLGGFLRNAKDFIYSIPVGNNSSQYLNEGKVLVYGGEGEAVYQYADLIKASINASYQRSKQNQEYIYGTETPRATYGNMIPNQPWFFGNLYFSIGKDGLLGKDSRLQFDWTSQYIQQFYLTWEAWGSTQSLNVIPKQLLHHAGILYSIQNGKYQIGIESRNLTNELAYDNFRLQKPGRSFQVKLRYFLR